MRAHPLVATALLAVFAGCEKVDYIEINPSTVEFKQPNNQVWLEAKCMARNGVRAVKARVAWTVKDPTIATVNEKGLLKPLASGETEVIATFGDVEGRANVNVVFVDRIEVEPKELKLKEGQEAFTPTVRAFGKNGRKIEDRTVTLSSKDKTIAQIVGSGAILPLDPGTTTIDVQVDGAKSSIALTVEADTAKKKK